MSLIGPKGDIELFWMDLQIDHNIGLVDRGPFNYSSKGSLPRIKKKKNYEGC